MMPSGKGKYYMAWTGQARHKYQRPHLLRGTPSPSTQCGSSRPSGAITTCTYTGAGEYQLNVPTTGSTLHIVAVGGRGGADYNGFAGGLGTQVTADLAVPPAVSILYLEVGDNGQQATDNGAA